MRLFFRGRDVASIKRADVRAYLRYRLAQGVKEPTVNREVRFACAAVNFVRLEHEIEMPNPFQSMRFANSEPIVRWITKDEARRLIFAAGVNAMTPYVACFISLAINTGCRRNELLCLEWSRVDLERRLFFLEPRNTKTKKRRSVPLNESAFLAITRLHEWHHENNPDSPWVFTSSSGSYVPCVKRAFKSACKRSGITNFRIHDMRHTCASWLVMAGIDLYVVRDLLGHTSIKTTERYAHLAPTKVAAAVASLDHKIQFC